MRELFWQIYFAIGPFFFCICRVRGRIEKAAWPTQRETNRAPALNAKKTTLFPTEGRSDQPFSAACLAAQILMSSQGLRAAAAAEAQAQGSNAGSNGHTVAEDIIVGLRAVRTAGRSQRPPTPPCGRSTWAPRSPVSQPGVSLPVIFLCSLHFVSREDVIEFSGFFMLHILFCSALWVCFLCACTSHLITKHGTRHLRHKAKKV